jgi:hypothetical protein
MAPAKDRGLAVMLTLALGPVGLAYVAPIAGVLLCIVYALAGIVITGAVLDWNTWILHPNAPGLGRMMPLDRVLLAGLVLTICYIVAIVLAFVKTRPAR